MQLLLWELIYVTAAPHTSSVHSNKALHVMYSKSDSWLVWNIFDFTIWVCPPVIPLLRTIISFFWGDLIGSHRVNLASREEAAAACAATGRERRETQRTQRDSVFAFALYYICTSHFLRPLNCTPRLGLIKLASEISVEHPPEVVKHTSRPTFGCVINHVEIKVKGEGLTLSSES